MTTPTGHHTTPQALRERPDVQALFLNALLAVDPDCCDDETYDVPAPNLPRSGRRASRTVYPVPAAVPSPLAVAAAPMEVA